MSNSTRAYHLEELEIVRNPDDERHLLPTLPNSFDTILDIGCGAGQTLIGCGLKPDIGAYGVDIDADALVLGKEIAPQIHFVRAMGERLPFADESFDVVIARVSLPFMNMPNAHKEIARVLREGGYVWMALHPFQMLRERVVKSLKSGNIKDLIYSAYIFGNGLLFHLSGKQIRFPLNRKKCESFQTARAMTNSLRSHGFENIRADNQKFFIVTTNKQG